MFITGLIMTHAEEKYGTVGCTVWKYAFRCADHGSFPEETRASYWPSVRNTKIQPSIENTVINMINE